MTPEPRCLPARGVPPADNEAGWRSSLAKLAALVEAVEPGGSC
jgi:hypothetical protein